MKPRVTLTCATFPTLDIDDLDDVAGGGWRGAVYGALGGAATGAAAGFYNPGAALVFGFGGAVTGAFAGNAAEGMYTATHPGMEDSDEARHRYAAAGGAAVGAFEGGLVGWAGGVVGTGIGASVGAFVGGKVGDYTLDAVDWAAGKVSEGWQAVKGVTDGLPHILGAGDRLLYDGLANGASLAVGAGERIIDGAWHSLGLDDAKADANGPHVPSSVTPAPDEPIAHGDSAANERVSDATDGVGSANGDLSASDDGHVLVASAGTDDSGSALDVHDNGNSLAMAETADASTAPDLVQPDEGSAVA